MVRKEILFAINQAINEILCLIRCKIILRVYILTHCKLHNLHTFQGCKKKLVTRISSKLKTPAVGHGTKVTCLPKGIGHQKTL